MDLKALLRFSAVSIIIYFCSFPAMAQENSLSIFFDDEMLVQTASRHPKPLTEVAENLTVVNGAAIEAMNGHTLYEVLARVPGLFVTYDGMDFGSDASLTIHGASSEDLHRILVLLDGVRLNLSSNGNAILNGIPVSIIERLEIIKGPASSSWGSAMGGVVNIITKAAWKKGHEGQVYGSYGTADSREVRMELSGKGTDAGYYLFAGNQHSDGLTEDRFFNNTQVYVKGNAALKPGIRLVLSGGSFRPEWKNLNFPPADLMIAAENRNGFFTSALDQSVGNLLSFHLSGGIIARNYTKKYNVLSGLVGTPGETLSKQTWREKSYNLNSRLVYSDDIHTFVLGAEYAYNRLETSVDSTSTAVAAWGTSPTSELPPATNKTVGVYVNDTLSWGRFTLTPGVRYDYNSISDDFISPSLGLVYRATENNRLRITAARGFSTPYFSLLRDISQNQSDNPNLKPEEIWSVQAGLETRSIPFLLCKTTLFFHNIDEIWEYNPNSGQIENGDNTKRSGFEIEVESVPFHGLSVTGGFTYTIDDPDNTSSEDFYNTQVTVNYTNPELFSLQLFGTALKWRKGTTFEAEEDFIWDLNISRHFPSVSFGSGFDLFVTVHNLFNGDQYWSSFYPNPERWIEAGLKFRF